MFLIILIYNNNYKRQIKNLKRRFFYCGHGKKRKAETSAEKKKEEHGMDANKRQRYEKISIELTRLVGGKENIQGVAHCATRLRIVLKDNELADLKAIEDVDLAKGVFVAGDQVQIIFGAGLVNDVYEVFAEHNNMKNMSLSDLKTVANKKMNPLQRIIKALSDVFVDIMPGILAAALLTGLSGVLGNLDFVKANDTLYGINRLINISSGAIFGFLPLAVAYSACKRFGGRPILGIVIGCIMLSDSLANAYAAAQVGDVRTTDVREVEVQDAGGPCGNRHLGIHAFEQRCLAAADAAYEIDELSRPDGEVDAAECDVLGTPQLDSAIFDDVIHVDILYFTSILQR